MLSFKNLRLIIENRNKQVEECRSVPEIVYCSECKHLVYLKDAQRIGIKLPGDMFSYEENFCPEHRKKYDRVKVTYENMYQGIGFGNQTRQYFREMEVDKNGEPIGYKKK